MRFNCCRWDHSERSKVSGLYLSSICKLLTTCALSTGMHGSAAPTGDRKHFKDLRCLSCFCSRVVFTLITSEDPPTRRLLFKACVSSVSLAPESRSPNVEMKTARSARSLCQLGVLSGQARCSLSAWSCGELSLCPTVRTRICYLCALLVNSGDCLVPKSVSLQKSFKIVSSETAHL